MTAVKSFTPEPEGDDSPMANEPLVREHEEPAPARVGKAAGKTGGTSSLRSVLKAHGIGKQ